MGHSGGISLIQWFMYLGEAVETWEGAVDVGLKKPVEFLVRV